MQIVTGYRGQAHITSNDEQGKNQGIFGVGSYVLNVGSKFSPTAVTANKIQIADGEGILQGVHFRVDPGTYDTVTIENGTQGMKRKDLIVCRYTKDNDTGVENTAWEVIKGTPAASNPTRPSAVSGDILTGATIADMAMYEVVLDGINLSAINPLFNTLVPQSTLLSRLATAENGISALKSKLVGWYMDAVRVAGEASENISITSGTRGIIFTTSSDVGGRGIYGYGATNSGGVNVSPLVAASRETLTTSTNTINIVNGSSSVVTAFVLRTT